MVSVVVPIYNTEKYINRCIDSLINQTFSDLEIILVDDGSTDGSSDVCDSYAKSDSRVKAIHQPNSGESKARNTGLAEVTGEYIVFCDSDDEYKPNSIELLLQAIECSDLALGAFVEVNGEETHYACTGTSPYNLSELILRILDDKVHYGTNYMMSCLQAKIFKSSIVKNNNLHFDENWIVGNDGLFVLDYLKHCEKIKDTFMPMYIYYKYDVNERVQGMAWHYPDMYRLNVEMHKKYYELLKKGYTKERMSQTFSSLIGSLIRACKYTNLYVNGFEKELEWFVNDKFIRQCAQYYLPKRPQDSTTILEYVLHRDTTAAYKEVFEKSSLISEPEWSFVRRIYSGN